MRGLLLFLLVGLVPAQAQMSIDNSASVRPAAPASSAEIQAAPDRDATAISDDALRTAAHVRQPELTAFKVSPGTVREGLTYREGARTVVTLSGPATKAINCRVISADPEILECGNISFEKGQLTQQGALHINWAGVTRDREISLRIYDTAHPETVLRSRIYLRKSLIQAN